MAATPGNGIAASRAVNWRLTTRELFSIGQAIMRVLFLHHFPLDGTQEGAWVRHAMLALSRAGHACRALVIAQEPPEQQSPDVGTLISRADDPTADLPYDLPDFGTTAELASGSCRFRTLSDTALAEYRTQFRRRLDVEIDQFNPHVIHCQHIWVQGQLALETGVPYVLNAWGPEMVEYRADARFRPLADQAAENAGRILAPSFEIKAEVLRLFESAADRTALLSPLMAASAPHDEAMGRELAALYEAVLEERFGRPARA